MCLLKFNETIKKKLFHNIHISFRWICKALNPWYLDCHCAVSDSTAKWLVEE